MTDEERLLDEHGLAATTREELLQRGLTMVDAHLVREAQVCTVDLPPADAGQYLTREQIEELARLP